jgi:acyl-CoA thioesterase
VTGAAAAGGDAGPARGSGGESEFDADTRLVPLAGGPGNVGVPGPAFSVDVSDRWSGMGGVNGGFLLALCLAGLSRELAFPDPIVVSGFFLRPGNPGVTRVRTEVIRSGRTTAFGQAILEQGGKEVVRATAAFADLSSVDAEYTGATAPKLPAPEDCQRVSGLSGISLASRLEYASPASPGWFAGKPSGDPSAEFYMRFADGRDFDTLSLPFIVDAAPPVVLELGAASTTIELTAHVRARPAPGWVACRVTTRFVSGGYHEEDVEIWDSAGTLVAQSRQLALIRR